MALNLTQRRALFAKMEDSGTPIDRQGPQAGHKVSVATCRDKSERGDAQRIHIATDLKEPACLRPC